MAETRTRADRIDRWLTIAARAQLRSSAWPYVAQSNSYTAGQSYTRQVVNEGVGPARIRAFRVLVDGRPVQRWGQAVRTLTDAADSNVVYTTMGRGSVLPAGGTRTLLMLPPGAQAERFWVEAQTRLETVVCYCSVYDECWEADTRRDEPRPVKACATDPAAELRQ